MNQKHLLFIQNYLIDGNGTQAYLKAYPNATYETAYVNASKLLRNPKVKEAAVNKYGPSKFIRTTIRVFDKLEDALDLERWLVDNDFIARRDTYNITLGGGIPPITVKTIYQYDLEGNFIKQWNSITEAAIHYKCSSSCIGRAIFDNTPSLKFLWTDYKSDKLNLDDFKIGENKKETYLYDINGYLVNTFDSITE